MYKIVFSDIDGTLLNSGHRVSPATRESVLKLRERGVNFVPVSARGPAGIYPILKKNNFVCPLIAYSGALILDEKGEVLFESAMDAESAGEIIDFIEAEKFPLAWGAYSLDDWIVRNRADPRIRLEESIVETLSREGDPRAVAGGKIHKILCICDQGKAGEIERGLRAKFPGINAVRSSDAMLEIMNPGVNKAKAAKILCDRLGVDPADAIAFGDNYNDLEMLGAVGLGVVMGNAPEAIKRRFSFVTAGNDGDGVALALAKIFPGE